MKPNEVFKDEVYKMKEELIRKHDQLGMRATGKWAKNLETFFDIRVDKYIANIIGLDYTEQLVQGQEPGTWPDQESMIEWIEAKPITPYDNISIESLAYLISRKIYFMGTDYFQEGGTDLIEDVITQERIQTIIQKVGELLVNDFKLDINQALQRIEQ